MQLFSFFSKKFRKVSAKLFYVLAALILILLTGCPADPFCVTPTNTQANRLTVTFSEGMSCERRASDIVEVDFYLNDKTKKFFPKIWTIKSKSKQGTRLDQLIYGILPKGFTQTALALPIRPRDKISVDAKNRAGIEGEIEITLKL
ncbi:MAG TPA: hypothetical protein VK203_24550 [Nostocaceae cyanobacterium]|nr:hypothetical protein [Nostocaceae cyanobacterium]